MRNHTLDRLYKTAFIIACLLALAMFVTTTVAYSQIFGVYRDYVYEFNFFNYATLFLMDAGYSLLYGLIGFGAYFIKKTRILALLYAIAGVGLAFLSLADLLNDWYYVFHFILSLALAGVSFPLFFMWNKGRGNDYDNNDYGDYDDDDDYGHNRYEIGD